MPTMPSFKDLPLWQHSMRMTVEIYQLTSRLPTPERMGIGVSLQQAAAAVPTLLASGSKSGRSGFRAACLEARQSAAELETLLIVVQQAFSQLPVDDLLSEADDLQNGLTIMARRLSGPGSAATAATSSVTAEDAPAAPRTRKII